MMLVDERAAQECAQRVEEAVHVTWDSMWLIKKVIQDRFAFQSCVA